MHLVRQEAEDLHCLFDRDIAIARLMGFGEHSMLVRYENGESCPSWARLAHMAKVYGLTLVALLAEQDQAVTLIAGIDQADAATVAWSMPTLRQSLRQGNDLLAHCYEFAAKH